MSDTALSGLGCPRCGGMVNIPEGQAVVLCPYCDQRSVVSGERGLRRYQVPTRVDHTAAELAGRGFFGSSAQIAPGLKNEAKVTEVFLVHLPFWSAWGRGVAWAFGQVKVGSGDNSHYEAREKKVVKDLSWNGVACDVGEFGVRHISLKGRPLEPFNGDQLHRTGMVFEPVGSDQEALLTAERDFEGSIKDDASLDRTSQLFARILSPILGVVYYPVWVMRYLFRGRAFQVVIDGYDGAVLYGKAPGNLLFRAAALVGGMAVGAFLSIDVAAFILSSFDGSSKDNPLAIVAVAFFGGLALMWTGYQRFRYGEHYEFQRYKEKDAGSGINFGSPELKELTGEIGKLLQ